MNANDLQPTLQQPIARRCTFCQQPRCQADLQPGTTLIADVRQTLQQASPAWSPEGPICQQCIHAGEALYMEQMLRVEKPSFGLLEAQVVDSVRTQQVLSVNSDSEFENKQAWHERLADHVARAVGSWYFSGALLIFLAGWIVINVRFRPFEPYPTIVLSVIGTTLSCLTALQGPIILMSQRRKAHLDRLRAEHDYRIDLKAELEIRYLHEKMDQMLMQQVQKS